MSNQTSISSVVKGMTWDFAPNKMPGFLWITVCLFNNTYRLWRVLRNVHLENAESSFVENAKNAALEFGKRQAVSHSVDFALSNTPLSTIAVPLRMTAQTLLITSKILRCVTQHTEVTESYKQFIKALKGSTIITTQEDWDNTNSSILSPSTRHYFNQKYQRTKERVCQVASTFFILLKNCFELAMRLKDASNAFFIRGNDVISELLNTTDRHQFEEDLKGFKTKLTENKVMVNALCEKVNLSTKADDLISKVDAALTAVGAANTGLNVAGKHVRHLTDGVGQFVNLALGLNTSAAPTSGKPKLTRSATLTPAMANQLKTAVI